MRILIASDIHGSVIFCQKLLENYKNEKADRLLLLGDILYHGPRNDLPEGYAPKEVIDSVVVHELCHLKEMNHSKRFYDEVLRVYPDYHKWHRWLKEHGGELMARNRV